MQAPHSIERRSLARLVEKLKHDQAGNRVKPVPKYKGIFMRAFPGLSGRDFDDIWRDAKTAPGVNKTREKIIPARISKDRGNNF